MKGPNGENCKDCYFFQQAASQEGTAEGVCYRGPPRWGLYHHFAGFPLTHTDDWCGEFKFKIESISK